MIHAHNPIALLISQIQQKWMAEVSPFPHLNLVRWLIKPEQAKLFEGFLKLESSAHGSVSEMFVVFLTPFQNKQNHSKRIIEQWIQSFRQEKEVMDQYQKTNPSFKWDVDQFESKISLNPKDNDLLLIEMMKAFQIELENSPFVLALLPYTIEDNKAYVQWLDTIVGLGLSTSLRLLIFDHENERYFDQLFVAHEDTSKSLFIDLDLSGAINKIASGGDPNDPEVQFRQCLLKMSKGVQNKDLTQIHKWGERGLQISQKTGQKRMLSTAHVVYASMLFQFKVFDKIDQLLTNGLTIAKQGLELNDQNCISLVLQCYGFLGSSKQLQKRQIEACDYYCKQAENARIYNFPQQALNAWWMAYNAIKKKDFDKYLNLMQTAYEYGSNFEVEVVKSSAITFIADDYDDHLQKINNSEEAQHVNAFMTQVLGKNWKSTIKDERKALEKKRFSLTNWF